MIITVSSAIDKLVMVYHSLALELFPDVLFTISLSARLNSSDMKCILHTNILQGWYL